MKLTILTLAIIMTIACAMADVVSKEMTRFASDYTLKTSFFEDTSANAQRRENLFWRD